MGSLHSAGVVHLDLTSDNIEVGTATDGFVVKMTGFGFSKIIATGNIGHKTNIALESFATQPSLLSCL